MWGGLLDVSAASSQPSEKDTTTVKESDYYKTVKLSVPEGVILEVGGLERLPDGSLAVSTRRGEVWLVKDPYQTGGEQPYFSRFAQGLHEPLGLLYRKGALYTAQRGKLTRLKDRNGDGRADSYKTVYSWPISGNYHEYSYGPELLPNGNLWVNLNLAHSPEYDPFIGEMASLAKWRGWALEISPEGKMTPIAAGMRSPNGLALNAEGDMFYSAQQGGWTGSGRITHLERGDFVGHPAGLKWANDPKSPIDLKPQDIPDTGQPVHEIAKEVPQLKPATVWIPHEEMGISTSDIILDNTAGRFGPFANQLLVGDQGHSRINRVFLEKVDGEYQGAVFPFLQGFSSGVNRLEWGKDGSLFVGMTDRGWQATGGEPTGLERVVWNGKTPLEIKKMHARSDGFELEFTLPVDPAVATNPSTYTINSFAYQYNHEYGSPKMNEKTCPIERVKVMEGGRRVRVVVGGLREGHVHQLTLNGLRAKNGTPLLHPTAYYTLNKVPSGPPLQSKHTTQH